MSLVGNMREAGSTVVAQYTVPVRGTWNSLAVHAIPADALYDSLNVYLRKGWLRARPGLTLLDGTVFSGPVLGGGMVVTPLEKRMLAFTSTRWYERGEFDGTWQDRGAVALTPDNNSLIDIAFMQTGITSIGTTSNYVGIIANPAHALKGYSSLLHTVAEFTPLAGSDPIPFASSVCVAASRVICLIPPHTIRWSKVLTPDNYPPLAYNIRGQTNDNGICVRPIGNYGFALYKERSIHLARAQGGGDETAFAFAEPIYVEGPAGIHALVQVTNSPTYNGHIYMTRNGRVALFSGSNYPQWIADGLWLFLQDDIDPVYAHMIHAVYDHRLHLVVFMYARKGDAGMVKGMVVLCLPYEGTDIAASGVAIPACFKGSTAVPCSFATEMRFNKSIDRSVFFSATPLDCQSFTLSEDTLQDDGQYYDCMLQTAMQALPQAQHHDVTIQTFLQRGSGYGAVLLEAVTSDGLETESGSVADGKGRWLNLETNPVQQHVGFGVMTRFIGLRYTWNSSSTVRYAGAIVSGRAII